MIILYLLKVIHIGITKEKNQQKTDPEITTAFANNDFTVSMFWIFPYI